MCNAYLVARSHSCRLHRNLVSPGGEVPHGYRILRTRAALECILEGCNPVKFQSSNILFFRMHVILQSDMGVWCNSSESPHISAQLNHFFLIRINRHRLLLLLLLILTTCRYRADKVRPAVDPCMGVCWSLSFVLIWVWAPDLHSAGPGLRGGSREAAYRLGNDNGGQFATVFLASN